MYELELESVAKEVKRYGAKKVLLQLPDGMRPIAFKLAESLTASTGAEVILSGDSCYGACDLASRQTLEIGADLLVHYGHSPMVETKVPVIYVEARIPVDPTVIVEGAAPHLRKWGRIGLASTVQHAWQLPEIAEALEHEGYETVMGNVTGKTPYAGQVIGCFYQSSIDLPHEVDGWLFIGGGKFHPLGLALVTGKPVVVANPYDATVKRIDEDEVMSLAKRRMAAITIAKSAKMIGVLVSSKPGQKALDAAELIVKKLRLRGVKVRMIYLDEVRTESLMNFSEAEAFIDTACPRIALDGVAGINIPILTIVEADVLIGDKRWEDVWGKGYLP